MNKITKTLESLGLNEKEIKIYLTSLSIGESSASILAQKNNIPRTSGIYACNSLVEKGLMNITPKGNTNLYSPKSVEKIISLVNKEYTLVDKKMREAHDILGYLKSLNNPSAKLPKVTYYTGSEGMIDLIDDIFKTDFEYLYGAMKYIENMPDEVIEYIKNIYTPKRVKLKIKSRFIMTDNKKSVEYANTMKGLDRKIIFIDEKEYPFSGYMQIYGNKVALLSYTKGDISGILIENEHIKNLLFSIFKIAWNATKVLPINKKYKNIVI